MSFVDLREAASGPANRAGPRAAQSAAGISVEVRVDEPASGVTAIPRQPGNVAWFSRLLTGIVAGDTLAILLSMLVASSFYLGPRERLWAPSIMQSIVTASVLGAVWLLSLSGAKSRARRVIGHGGTEYQRVINATLIAFGSVTIVCYVGRIGFARGYVAVALPVGIVLLVVNRFIWRRMLAALRRRDRCLSGVVVVGSARDVARTVGELRRDSSAGYRPVGVSLIDSPGDIDPAVDARLSDLARVSFDDVVSAARSSRVRAIMVAGDLPGGRGSIRELGWALENSCSELILDSRLTDVAGPRVHLGPVAGLPMVHVQLPQYTGLNHVVKRGFDIALSGLALLVLSPVFAVIALLVRRNDGGPVIFRQERVGVQGSTFTMFKFRSMVMDAESRLAELSSASEGNGVLFKVRDDPRVTTVGGVLRRYSLDELPQLWNVFRGDMSLVGPRPPLPSEVEGYHSYETRRLLTKPGITGLWQVSGRSDLTWAESIRLDLYYVENWSLTGDLVLLLRTVAQVIRPDGAY